MKLLESDQTELGTTPAGDFGKLQFRATFSRVQERSESSPEGPNNQNSISLTTDTEYVEVAVPVHVLRNFMYRVPPTWQSMAQPGARVVVPLGKKLLTGYIVALHQTLPEHTGVQPTDIKDAVEILDSVPLVTPELLDLTDWVAGYYLAPLGEVIKGALPPGISPNIEQLIAITEKGLAQLNSVRSANSESKSQQLLKLIADSEEVSLAKVEEQFDRGEAGRLARQLESEGLVELRQRAGGRFVKPRYERRVRLVPEGGSTEAAGGRKLSDLQAKVLDALQGKDSIALSDLLNVTNVSASTVLTLQKRKLVELFEVPVRRDPLGGEMSAKIEDYVLTNAQEEVLAKLETPLRERTYAPFLLHGVTGSGKTEVYIRAMRVALKLGRAALMLVPEIALTPVFSRRLRMHFGDKVAIFHSSLSRGERFDEWTRARNGEARIIIGTRSAVFAPIKNLGLIIIDEEHESTYRQQDSPHYNGRDTAIVRAQKESAVVVLGSATPSLESFHNAATGKYGYLQLPERLGNRPLAVAEIIDMREVFARYKKPRIFSDQLLQAIEDTHRKGEQSIILLNRRGYSSFVLCRSCGESIQCPNCDVTLTYHRSDRIIVCHYCNHREAAPDKCPNCKGRFIYYVGEGTQQIEEKLAKLFPTVKIARVDRDTGARRGAFEKTLRDFGTGELEMLVGTQILAKGHDFPNVTLVGVVSVDAGLALPDFRAAERTFQLLTQVAGRAGRGDRAGKVLIQTYHPHHYALRHASSQDYAGFYQEEIRHRQNHTYPPFVALGLLLVRGSDLTRVRADAVELRKALDQANPERSARILGPAPAPLARLKDEFRIQILIKCRNRRQLRNIIDEALNELSESKVSLRSINVEIDPVSVM